MGKFIGYPADKSRRKKRKDSVLETSALLHGWRLEKPKSSSRKSEKVRIKLTARKLAGALHKVGIHRKK